ncbi:hypothetical protein HHI36_007164 [Cryptolaemus montrouzieri]|uniref:Uncharacterized protein n=1 Tax=Cryptolaemus montrouzieri TaxID=559131 RepID=A0ABD2MPL0_9CUCU
MEVKLVKIVTLFFLLGCIQAEISRSITKGLQKCFDKGGLNGVVNCAGLRTLNMIKALSEKDQLEVLPGIVLVKEVQPTVIPIIKQDELPENPTNQSEKILELLSNATVGLVSQRTLIVKLPKMDSEELSRALHEDEGRGRKKNKFGGFGGMMGPLILSIGAKLFALIAGVGILSAKALVVAKLALVISAILFIQYYFSNRGGSLPPFYNGGSYYPSVTYGTNNLGGWNPQYPYARSLEVASGTTDSYEGEQIAYNSYTQKK